MPAIQVELVTTEWGRRRFVRFPWRVYKDDPNWVPPLIPERLEYLNPQRGLFYEHAEVALLIARRDGEMVGTIAPFVDHHFIEHVGKRQGGFGFFEVVEDYAVARALLDTARRWLRDRGMVLVRGPTSFCDNDCPGVLVEATDCPPVILGAHTPLYYRNFLERYGMEKDVDLYAWRAFRSQIGAELKNLPPEISRVAEFARRVADVDVRTIRVSAWDEEIATAHRLFTTTLHDLSDRAAMTLPEFRRLANQFRPFLDPDLVLFAEADGETVGFCVAIPDINRALIHLKTGRLFPLGWLKLRYYVPRIDVVTFKLMGILEKYRRRGIDALLYLQAVKAFYEGGYRWLDGSVTSETNPRINLLAQRLGAERYKHYRLYRMAL
jgi:GNAT superfamily N-acetyltransferase